ncbi:binary toxin-like calcium binding domain-containing protein [Bacillus bombysepticus]
MKKKLASVLTCTLLTSMALQGNPNFIHAEPKVKQAQNTQKTEEKVFDKKGLLGYYFKGKNFNDLLLFASTRDSTLVYDQQVANSILDKKQQKYQSIRWIGFINSKETGDFTFLLSDDEHATIEIDGKIISQKGKNKQVVHLEKDKLVSIKIEYQSNESINLDSKVFQDLKLFKKDSKNQLYQMQQDELRNPEFSRKADKGKETEKIEGTVDGERDSDKDGIPDIWEIDGYTVQQQMAVKWDDSLAEKGYKKYVSNPNRAHTTGDPYSDFEKAKKEIPAANAKEAFNPLVAAFPSVNVGLEKVIISKNNDMSQSVGSSSSNNWSYTNTEGASVEAGIGPEGISFGVSAHYEHSETVAKEWGHSKEDTAQFNEAQSAFLNANVRYNNVGTGAIYDVIPTTSFNLNGTTIETIKATEDITALALQPGESYPERGQNGIAITKINESGLPIPLNKDQLDTYLSNRAPILLETNQVEGKYAEIDENGQTVIGGGWNGIQQEIENRTASIIVDSGKETSEKRVAGKDYTNPEDKTPSLTLNDALKLAYPEEITEKDGLLYYNDNPIYESSVMTYLDKNTAKEVKKQLNDTTGIFKDVNHLYDVKLTPKMNFTIKLATIHDGAESGTYSNTPLGNWYYTFNVSDGNTGKHQYRSSHPSANVVLSSEAKDKLTKNSQYYLSLYMKAEADTEATIEAVGTESTIKKTTVKLNNKGYQRVDILVENSEQNPIKQIYMLRNGDDKTDVYWDDVSLTEISAIKDMTQDLDEEVQKAHTFKGELIGLSSKNQFIKQLTLHVNQVKDNHDRLVPFEYRVKAMGRDLGKKLYKPDREGNITIDFSEYNNGQELVDVGDIQIYAVYNGREVKVAEHNRYNISGKIHFRNDGESGRPEPYGHITFMFEGQSFEKEDFLWDKSHNDALDVDGTTNWYIPYSENFGSFNPNPNVIFKANVKESDDGNGDDVLAYPKDEYKSSLFKGEAIFKGDEKGTGLNITYDIKKLESN